MIAFLGLVLPALAADVCQELKPVDGSLQVVYVAPAGDQVEGNTWLEVVSVAQLRAFVSEHEADQLRVLQGLGLVSAKGTGRRAKRPYDARVFEVTPEALCRPLLGRPHNDVAGVPVCTDRNQMPIQGRGASSFTGCGYTLDSATKERGFDVYRVQWKDADDKGFCVWPLERFLGAS